MSFFGFCIRNILKDVVDTTVQKGAQIIDCHSAQWFIVTQAVNRRTADPVLINKSVCTDTFFLSVSQNGLWVIMRPPVFSFYRKVYFEFGFLTIVDKATIMKRRDD